jgi:hypothetical protein
VVRFQVLPRGLVGDASVGDVDTPKAIDFSLLSGGDVDPNIATGWLNETRDDTTNGGLSTPRLSDEPHGLTARDAEVDAVYGSHLTGDALENTFFDGVVNLDSVHCHYGVGVAAYASGRGLSLLCHEETFPFNFAAAGMSVALTPIRAAVSNR